VIKSYSEKSAHVGQKNGAVSILDLNTFESTEVAHLPTAIQDLSYATASSRLAIIDETGLLVVQDSARQRLFERVPGQEYSTFSMATKKRIAFNPKGDTILIAGKRKYLKVALDPEKNALYTSESSDSKSQADIAAIAWSPQEGIYATAGADGCVTVYHVQFGELLTFFASSLHVTRFPTVELSFSRSGERLVRITSDGLIAWDAPVAPPTIEIGKDLAHISLIQLSPDGSRLVTLSTSRELVTWDARTGAEINRKSYDYDIEDISFDSLGSPRLHPGPMKAPLFSIKSRLQSRGLSLLSKEYSIIHAKDHVILARQPDEEEFKRIRWRLRPLPEWHRQQAEQSKFLKNPFSEALHRRSEIEANQALLTN
jgi:WD40 repeat protein